MKKTILILAGVTLSGIVFEGCLKKGDNDPSISFRSRKARLSGDWKMVSGNLTKVLTWSNGVTATYEYAFDGTNVVVTYNGNTYPAWPYKETFSFDKSGTFSQQITEGASPASTHTYNGNWEFHKKDKSAGLKNKEAVSFLSVTETHSSGSTTYYTDVTNGQYWALDKLTNEEIVFKIETTGTNVQGVPETTTGTLTYTQ